MVATAERILDSAQGLAQARGYNGFSYADISAQLGISKPSIHHHFPSKGRLAEALVARYRERFDRARAEFEEPGLSPRGRLAGYAGLYAQVFSDGARMCLCGVFAADASSLPPAAREATAAFFADQQDWVTAVFHEAGVARPQAQAAARAYLAALEGALLLARAEHAHRDSASPTRSSPATPAVVPAATAGGVTGVAGTLLDALLPGDS